MKTIEQANMHIAVLLLATIVSLIVMNRSVRAHEGEDHGAEQPPVVSADAGLTTRVVRAGDYEITWKHPALEPDRELAARVFVTKFDTNEPVAGARIVMTIANAEGALMEAAAAGTSSGVYEVKLPPLAQGQYKFGARVSVSGISEGITFGTISVAPRPPTAAESSTSWARTLLILLALLAGLGLGGAIIYRLVRGARATHADREPATV